MPTEASQLLSAVSPLGAVAMRLRSPLSKSELVPPGPRLAVYTPDSESPFGFTGDFKGIPGIDVVFLHC